MKRKLNQEVSRFCPLPASCLVDESVHSKTLSRRLRAMDFLIEILDEEKKFSPHVFRKVGRIDWDSLEGLPWTDEELLSIQWMKTIWTEKMHVVPREKGGFWPSNIRLREAILKALAIDGGMPLLIDSNRHQQKQRGLLSLLTGTGAA